MNLMIKARWLATKHIVTHWSPGHRIWRLYSHFGFNTMAVVCEYGEVFEAKDHLAAARALTFINWRKARRSK